MRGSKPSLRSAGVIWPTGGMIVSVDHQSLLTYALTAPFTHGDKGFPDEDCSGKPASDVCHRVGQRTQIVLLKQRMVGVRWRHCFGCCVCCG